MQGDSTSILNQQVSNSTDGNQYVTFSIDEEEFGIQILKVQEIIGYTKPTHLPDAPDFINGVINLRGVIIPVIDLRKKFNMPEVGYDKFTVVIVIEVAAKTMGIIVDSVSDVLTLSQNNIQPVPEFSKFHAEYLKGIGKAGDKLIILLDIDKILTTDEHDILSEFVEK